MSTSYSMEYSNMRLEKYMSNNMEVVVTTADEEAMAGDIYKHLRESEANRRPSTDFMEKIQKGSIDASMRADVIDWLVVVAEYFKLVPDTLFLAVNYIDRYLSGNVMDWTQLRLLGVTCLMIAAKYDNNESNEAAQKWCDITENTYVETEVLQMELAVLRYLKYQMTAPTAVCFLRRFCFVAQRCSGKDVLAPSEVNFWCLALYIAELSLVEYKMLCYAPSLIAASSVFLAKFLLCPSTRPWNSTLRHCTLYQVSDLCECVEELRDLICYDAYNSRLTAIRDKYCQPKYQFVATKYCSPPDSIPPEFFHDISN